MGGAVTVQCSDSALGYRHLGPRTHVSRRRCRAGSAVPRLSACHARSSLRTMRGAAIRRDQAPWRDKSNSGDVVAKVGEGSGGGEALHGKGMGKR